MLLAWILAAILSIADWTAQTLLPHRKMVADELVSFSAGVGLTYLILQMLPELYFTSLNQAIFMFVLVGFIVLHLTEKYVYRHAKIKQHHRQVHAGVFFLYSFSIGMLLHYFVQRSYTDALIFFIPFVLYAVIEIFPQELTFSKTHRVFLSAAPLYGTLVATLANFTFRFYDALIGLVAGALLYLIVREAIPPEKRGRPAYFVLGVLFYSAILLLQWFIVG